MRIAYLFSRYPVPSQTFCDTEICALEAAGHEVEIYSCSPPTTSFRHGGPRAWPRAEVLYAPPAPALEAWVRVAVADGTWPAAMIADHATRFGPHFDPARRARHALYFADRLRRRGVEHLHVHFANRATHAALFIHELTGLPFSFTAHAQDFLVDLGNDDLLRLFCEKAAFVVAVSNWSRAALAERCPAAAGKIHRVYNGLELARWPQSTGPVAAPPPDQGLRIFSVGRLIEFKGFQDLIAACGLLRERGVRFSCQIAGEGPLRQPLERLAAGFTDPSAQVCLSGLLPQEEVRAHLEACDVFALACCVDAKGACDVLPTVILEAMAAGRPVVSTRLAAVPEMVRDGVTGLLSVPGDPAALAQSLATLAASPSLCRRQGRAGREKLAAEFSAAAAARALARLFSRAHASSTFVPRHPESEQPSAEVLCLWDRWPEEPDPQSILSADLLAPVRLHHLVFRPGAFREDASLNPEALRASNFLPDDLVLETLWRQPLVEVHRLEGRRAEVGGACSTEAFLLAARRALYLSHWLRKLPGAIRHLHAVGPQALLCTFLLSRLGAGGSASFFLPERSVGSGEEMAGSTLRKLVPGFVGGWVVNERKLTVSLGSTFRHDAPDPATWMDGLARWAGG